MASCVGMFVCKMFRRSLAGTGMQDVRGEKMWRGIFCMRNVGSGKWEVGSRYVRLAMGLDFTTKQGST